MKTVEKALKSAHEELERRENVLREIERKTDWDAAESGAFLFGHVVGYDDGQTKWIAWLDDYLTAVESLAEKALDRTISKEDVYQELVCNEIPMPLFSRHGSSTLYEPEDLWYELEKGGETLENIEEVAQFLGLEVDFDDPGEECLTDSERNPGLAGGSDLSRYE